VADTKTDVGATTVGATVVVTKAGMPAADTKAVAARVADTKTDVAAVVGTKAGATAVVTKAARAAAEAAATVETATAAVDEWVAATSVVTDPWVAAATVANVAAPRPSLVVSSREDKRARARVLTAMPRAAGVSPEEAVGVSPEEMAAAGLDAKLLRRDVRCHSRGLLPPLLRQQRQQP